MKDNEIQKINVIITFDDSREQDWFDIWIDKKVYPRVLEEESSLVRHILEGLKKKKNVCKISLCFIGELLGLACYKSIHDRNGKYYKDDIRKLLYSKN